MPYGVSKKLGGDSAKNDRWMEKRVASIQRSVHDKVKAIKIAKSQMKKGK
jgi:hypothetical protein